MINPKRPSDTQGFIEPSPGDLFVGFEATHLVILVHGPSKEYKVLSSFSGTAVEVRCWRPGPVEVFGHEVVL